MKILKNMPFSDSDCFFTNCFTYLPKLHAWHQCQTEQLAHHLWCFRHRRRTSCCSVVTVVAEVVDRRAGLAARMALGCTRVHSFGVPDPDVSNLEAAGRPIVAAERSS